MGKKSRNSWLVSRDVQKSHDGKFREFPVGNHRRAWSIGKFCSRSRANSIRTRSLNEFYGIEQIERKFVTRETHRDIADHELASERRLSFQKTGKLASHRVIKRPGINSNLRLVNSLSRLIRISFDKLDFFYQNEVFVF